MMSYVMAMDDRLVLNLSMLSWPNSTRGTIPRSICSEPCPNGSIRNFQVCPVIYLKKKEIPAALLHSKDKRLKTRRRSCYAPLIILFTHSKIDPVDSPFLQDQCCWICVPCREDSYSFNDTCVTCEAGFAPNAELTGCVKIPAEHLTWDSPWAIVPLVFTALGVTATLFILAVFLRYNRYHPYMFTTTESSLD